MTATVLVVDDDAALRKLLTLKVAGDPRFAVVGEAGDGHRALQLIATCDPDVVLLDLHMPRMDGLAVLAALDGRPRPVVVVLSGLLNGQDRAQLLASGAALCLAKIADLGELPDRLAAVIFRTGHHPSDQP